MLTVRCLVWKQSFYRLWLNLGPHFGPKTLRDCQQITLITLNRFFRWAKIPPCPPSNSPSPSLLLTGNTKIDRIMKNIYSFYIVFQWWKFVRHSHQIFYFLLFLLAFTSAHFSQLFRTLFNIIWQKDFCHGPNVVPRTTPTLLSFADS